jgi:uncharacterized protein (DUF488 family)
MRPPLGMATIGVYGFDGESFLRRLRQAEVRLLLDVRQRRGVRGPGALAAELRSYAVAALFCVERDPEACHRSLVAERLRAEHGLPVTDLRPD